jgi:hypothetical protein
MQPLRRWVPGSAKDPVKDKPRQDQAPLPEICPRDIAFCSELGFHGGVAVSEQGFKSEAELLRMREAGLLDLQRDPAPPFAITRVALSAKARDLLAGRVRISTGGQNRTAEGQPGSAGDLRQAQEKVLRRNGFEVARGMIAAGVKSEIAAWKAAGGPGGYATLEARILTRIGQIEIPFPV